MTYQTYMEYTVTYNMPKDPNFLIGVQKVWAQSRNLAEEKVKADHPGVVIGRVEVTNSITAVIG